MSVFYLDTSALIKHYVLESGSGWVDASLFAPKQALLLTSRVTLVEVRSALARRRREASISPLDHAEILAAFRDDCDTRYRLIELEQSVAEAAGDLLDAYELRAYDAIQLASALSAAEVLAQAILPELIFVTADERLLDVAQAAGLRTENPNLH